MKRALLAAGGVAGSAYLLHCLPGATQLRRVRLTLAPHLAGVGRANHIALTFDDGPDAASTGRFLDALSRRGVRATFFMLGEMAARDPGVAREVVQRGHEAALHGYDHTNLLLRTPWSTRQDIRRGREVVEQATGARVEHYRPPYGVLSASALLWCRTQRLSPVLWSAWGEDWSPTASAATVAGTVRDQLEPGGTVLLHDSDCTSTPGSWRATLGAIDAVVDAAHALGCAVGPLTEHF